MNRYKLKDDYVPIPCFVVEGRLRAGWQSPSRWFLGDESVDGGEFRQCVPLKLRENSRGGHPVMSLTRCPEGHSPPVKNIWEQVHKRLLTLRTRIDHNMLSDKYFIYVPEDDARMVLALMRMVKEERPQ